MGKKKKKALHEIVMTARTQIYKENNKLKAAQFKVTLILLNSDVDKSIFKHGGSI